MSVPALFQFESVSVRVQVDSDGFPWFNANDVCEALQLGNARQALESHVDTDDVQKLDAIDSLGRTQRANHVNESGLYALILGSTKDAAKRFKHWVTSEVLPQIRQTGAYLPPQGGPKPLTELDVAESVARSLRLSSTSQLRMFGKICEIHGLSQAFLPPYVNEGLTRSMTALLKEHQSPVSVRSANLALQELGLLEVLTRAGSRGQEKAFKSLTEAGLAYGRNETSPQNPRETQPLYYVDRFPDLLKLIHEVVLAKDAH